MEHSEFIESAIEAGFTSKQAEFLWDMFLAMPEEEEEEEETNDDDSDD